MRARDRVAAVLAVAIGLAGCGAAARVHPPPGWQVATRPGPGTGYGAWGLFALKPSSPVRGPIEGELIAIDRDSTAILTDEGLVTLATSEVLEGRLLVRRMRNGKWVVERMVELANASRRGASLINSGEQPRLQMRPYARFPQGVPAGVDTRRLTLPR